MQDIQKQSVITKIEKQKKKQQRYNIFIDDEYVCAIHEDILIKYQIYKDKMISQIFIDELIAAEVHHQVYLDAIKMLTNRSNSSKEIKQKLRKKGHDIQTIHSVIDILIEQNYIDDEKFAKEWVLQQMNQHQGIHRIRYDLKQKGLKNDEIQQAVQLYTKDMELTSAVQTAEKKIRSLSGSPIQQKNKLISFLIRRGFSTETIKLALKSIHFAENDLDEDFIDEIDNGNV